MKDSKELLYDKQSKIFSDTSEEHIKLTESWFDETTADYWLHNRMYEAADCIAGHESATWLTIGDGRWGLDSIRLKKRGIANIIPTDICETLLKASKEKGLIDKYHIENAEKLSFPDNSFDYIFCKESFHHFPRPYIALYEMLRVASKAVILVEPNDDPLVSTIGFKTFIGYKIKNFLARKGLCKKPRFYGKTIFPDYGYETSGNYVYSISNREAQKIARGLNLPQLAFKGYNSHYIKGCEFEPADINKSAIFKEIVDTVNYQDEKCKLGLLAYSGIMLIFFKEKASSLTINELKSRDWTIIDLPKNPYL
ncbi:MAG: class I SAM-dependent methyltransferase [Bacteroidales bacterium]|nr:class I SAM-dependent methyltransferase [Bacteroidales bacterium]